MDFVNAKRVLNTKYRKKQIDPKKNGTLADHIMNARRAKSQDDPSSSPSGSIDISHITSQKDERRSPTPEPTKTIPAKRRYSHESPKDDQNNNQQTPEKRNETSTGRRGQSEKSGDTPDRRKETPVNRRETPDRRQNTPDRRTPNQIQSSPDKRDKVAFSFDSESECNQYCNGSIVAISPIVEELKPAYSESAFEFLQEVNRNYLQVNENSDDTRPHSDLGHYQDTSDLAIEPRMRRTLSGNIRRRRRHHQQCQNPNDLTLAQKLQLHRRVMSIKDSQEELQRQNTITSTTNDINDSTKSSSPLPLIKGATPRPDSKNNSPKPPRGPPSRAESRNVLPPIRNDSRAWVRDRQPSRASTSTVTPPQDTREFDPNLGVGIVDDEKVEEIKDKVEEVKPDDSPINTVDSPEKRIQSPKRAETPKRESPKRAETPKRESPKRAEPTKRDSSTMDRSRSSSRNKIVPIVAVPVSRSKSPVVEKSHSRSRKAPSPKRSSSRSTNREKKRSRSRSISRSASRGRRRSRSKSRIRSKSRSRSGKRHGSRSRSRSNRRGHRRERDRSRSRHRSYSPRTRRRQSRSRSRERYRSYNREETYDSTRSYSQNRGRHQSRPSAVELRIVQEPTQVSHKKPKKKIIILNNQVPQTSRANSSDSDSEPNISVIGNVQTGKKTKKKKARRKSYTDESDDSSRSRSRGRKKTKPKKSKKREETDDSTDLEENDYKVKVKKGDKNNNKRSIKKQKKSKHKKKESETEEESVVEEDEQDEVQEPLQKVKKKKPPQKKKNLQKNEDSEEEEKSTDNETEEEHPQPKEKAKPKIKKEIIEGETLKIENKVKDKIKKEIIEGETLKIENKVKDKIKKETIEEETLKIEKKDKVVDVTDKKAMAKTQQKQLFDEPEIEVKETSPILQHTRQAVQASVPPASTKFPNNGANNSPNERRQLTSDLDIAEALEQLDKQVEYELNILKGVASGQKPIINTKAKELLFSKQNQEKLELFLNS